MIGSLPYLNSPVMAVAGASAKIRRALGDITPDVQVEAATTETVLARLQRLNARVVALTRSAPPTPQVQASLTELAHAITHAASDLRYAQPADAEHIIADIERRVDVFQELVVSENVVALPARPGETSAFPGGTTGLLLAGTLVLGVGSILVIATKRRKRSSRRR